MSFCFIGASAVMLDLKADRYYRLDQRHSAVLRAFGGSTCDVHLEARQSLIAKGTHSAWRRAAREAGECTTRHCQCYRAPGVPVDRREGMFDIDGKAYCASVYCRPGSAPPPDCCAPSDIIDGGATASLTSKAVCKSAAIAPPQLLPPLPTSIAFSGEAALRTGLARSCHDPVGRGCAAGVYFGVRLEPLRRPLLGPAGDLLLSDPLDSIAEFTPVFEL